MIVDSLNESVPALAPLRPFTGRGLFVQRFAGPESEENPARIEQAQGRERLRHDAGLYRNVGHVTVGPIQIR
jgi:hypothetical protein